MIGDRAQGLFWIAVGGAIFYASWTMDRLASVGVQPYSAPGLLPGVLGVFIFALGAAMLLRGRREPVAEPMDWRRIGVPLALCLGFAAGLVGHGLPFWLAAWIFVSAAIFALQRGSALRAILIGAGASLAISLVFQELFLIRLP